jgi:hypothetical protein
MIVMHDEHWAHFVKALSQYVCSHMVKISISCRHGMTDFPGPDSSVGYSRLPAVGGSTAQSTDDQ